MEGYCVYEHVFPNGKRYVGVSKDPQRRWKSDGSGYISNQPMWKDINKYGWDNIQHNIIESGLSRTQAQRKERDLIEEFDLVNNGYNQNPGGAISGCLYSKHVMKMIRSLKRFPYLLGEDVSSFTERLQELSDDEGFAYQINLVDYVLRTEVDGYIHGTRELFGDEIYEVVDWFYYISHWTMHPEIHLKDIPSPSMKRQEVFEGRGDA